MAWRKDPELEVQEQQARALAYLLNQIRPDWPAPSLLALMEKNREVPSLGALVIAATTKALEPTCQTPAPIFAAGNHWPEAARADLPPPEECPTHTGKPRHNCGGCRADRIAQKPEAVPTGAASVVQEDK